jgi:hypothetical protein
MPDLGGIAPTIFDAYWDGKFVPQFTVRAGKFKPPIGLERLQSATDIAFAERGLPTNLVRAATWVSRWPETYPRGGSPTRSESSTACPRWRVTGSRRTP